MKTWIPSNQTDIRRTWLANWPTRTRDDVYYRIYGQVKSGDRLPISEPIQLVKRIDNKR